jgi:Xaa-Pro aminopeptidase
MPGKIAASLADATPETLQAAGEGHHLTLGPGSALAAEWLADGLVLPDLDAMQQYRFDRVQEQLAEQGVGGIILMDPMNLRYATASTNMQIWAMHNACRYAWVGADGSVILWEFSGCEFLAGHSRFVQQVRPAVGTTYFIAAARQAEQAARWSAEMLEVIREHAGLGVPIAFDHLPFACLKQLEARGVTVIDGQVLMEMARRIKGPDEIRAMRCAVHACEATTAEMREALAPGMTEREVWAKLHAGNIRRAGEWIETQILSSGPRTNPWMQEASSRIIEDGDIVAYDTDLVGAYGMMVDISRSWLAGDKPARPVARQAHSLAVEQLVRNTELLTPGRRFRELTFEAWTPPVEDYRHYCCLFHGVGQCDEYPEIYFPEAWQEWGSDGVLEPNMVLTVEAFVGSRHGGEGVKLENQVLVTEDGPELLTHLSLDL